MTGVYRAEVERDGVTVIVQADVSDEGSYVDEAELGEAVGFYATRLLRGRVEAIERRERLVVEDAEEVRAASAVNATVEVGFCKDPGPLRYTNGDPILCVLLDGHAGPHTDDQDNCWQIDPWAGNQAPKVLLTDRRRDTPVPF